MGQVFVSKATKPPFPRDVLRRKEVRSSRAHADAAFPTDGGWLEEPRFPIDSGNPQFAPNRSGHEPCCVIERPPHYARDDWPQRNMARRSEAEPR